MKTSSSKTAWPQLHGGRHKQDASNPSQSHTVSQWVTYHNYCGIDADLSPPSPSPPPPFRHPPSPIPPSPIPPSPSPPLSPPPSPQTLQQVCQLSGACRTRRIKLKCLEAKYIVHLCYEPLGITICCSVQSTDTKIRKPHGNQIEMIQKIGESKRMTRRFLGFPNRSASLGKAENQAENGTSERVHRGTLAAPSQAW